MPTTEGAAACRLCGKAGCRGCQATKPILIVDSKRYVHEEDLRSARWALRAAVERLGQLGDSPVEKFIRDENAKCELTPVFQEITPTCDTCRFARGYSCCAHPVTIPFPRRRWCGEYQEKAP